MKITELLKSWLVENFDVREGSSDDDFRKAAGEAMASGKLSAEKFVELTKDPEEDEANEFAKKMDAMASNLGKLVEVLSAEKKEEKKEDKKEVKTEDKAEDKKDPKPEDKKEKTQPSQLSKMVSSMSGAPTPTEIDGKGIDIRVKEAAEQYDNTKSARLYPAEFKGNCSHPLAGQRMTNYDEQGHGMDTSSDLDRAVSGAYAKFCISAVTSNNSRTIGFQKLSQHDKELLFYAMENMKWGGSNDGGKLADICDRKLTQHEKQSLIDDAVSGGLEAAPIVFDDDVISTPLLFGELFPLVKRVPIDRGRRIEAVETGQVTGNWGGVDSTAITLFNTAAYVTAFDTTIFRWEAAIRIGLDFLSDTPIDFGRHVTDQIGNELLRELDNVIATGDGATQPLGILGSAGTTVAFGGVAATLGNYETLRFSVTKPEHQASLKNSIVFAGTEVSYSRARGIPVGAADARRLGGMDYDSYRWMERDFKINESFTNAQILYVVLGRYRMYVRRGITFRSSREGQTLIRNNELLITATARYGGQLERGAAAARTITAQA